MSTVNISLPDALKHFVDEQVTRAGYSSVSDYVRHLIRQEQARDAERRLAELIRQGLESGPARPAGPDYWAAKRRMLRVPAAARRRKA